MLLFTLWDILYFLHGYRNQCRGEVDQYHVVSQSTFCLRVLVSEIWGWIPILLTFNSVLMVLSTIYPAFTLITDYEVSFNIKQLSAAFL